MPGNHDTPNYLPLVRGVARALRSRCKVGEGAAIVVGCSGGADSVALVRVLALLAKRRKWGLKLVVAHIQHHLRGDEAETDAAFVAQLADGLGLPYARRDIRPGDLPGNVEANARDLRYEALAEIASEHNAEFIATAHHADDQLETLLMRMLRGSSVQGLRGIAWSKTHTTVHHDVVHVIRPMLSIDQYDITALLNELNQSYREDTTNRDTDRTRARLRHDVLPVLKQIQCDAPQKASDLVEHFDDVYRLVDSVAAKSSSHNNGIRLVLSREEARTTNRAVLGQMLRNALINEDVPPGRVTRHALQPVIRAAQDHAGGTRTFTFANGVSVTITRERISMHR